MDDKLGSELPRACNLVLASWWYTAKVNRSNINRFYMIKSCTDNVNENFNLCVKHEESIKLRIVPPVSVNNH